jgi:hypothetical protein
VRDGGLYTAAGPLQERGRRAGAMSAAGQICRAPEERRVESSRSEGWIFTREGGLVGKTGQQLVKFEDSTLSWAVPGRPPGTGTMNENGGEGKGRAWRGKCGNLCSKTGRA